MIRSDAARIRVARLIAMRGPTAGEIIGNLADGAQALMGMVEKLSQTRDLQIADQLAIQAEGIRRTAMRARMAILSSQGRPPDAAA
jgi:hypothetical protein